MKKMPCVHMYDSYREELATLSNSQFGILMRALLEFNACGVEPKLSGALRHIWPSIKGQYLRDAQVYEKRCESNRQNALKRGRKDTELVEEKQAAVPDQATQEMKDSHSLPSLAMAAKDKEKDKEKDKDRDKEYIHLLSGEASDVCGAGEMALAASPDERTAPPNLDISFSPPSAEQVANFCSQQGLQIDAEYFVNYYAARGWYLGNAPMKDWKAAVKAWAKTQRRGNHGENSSGNDIFSRVRQAYGPIGRCL